jgi:hypothetical protein
MQHVERSTEQQKLTDIRNDDWFKVVLVNLSIHWWKEYLIFEVKFLCQRTEKSIPYIALSKRHYDNFKTD